MRRGARRALGRAANVVATSLLRSNDATRISFIVMAGLVTLLAQPLWIDGSRGETNLRRRICRETLKTRWVARWRASGFRFKTAGKSRSALLRATPKAISFSGRSRRGTRYRRRESGLQNCDRNRHGERQAAETAGAGAPIGSGAQHGESSPSGSISPATACHRRPAAAYTTSVRAPCTRTCPGRQHCSSTMSCSRRPASSQDSYGAASRSGDHANLQYRINGVQLPDAITGFGAIV